MKHVDFLIVGQGIAGTLFAHECQKRGHSLLLFDPGHSNASLTAAGMYNPVVLKRFTPVWQGLAQIQRLRQTAAELTEKLGVVVDYPLDILRVFHDDNERQTWQKKAAQPLLEQLLDRQLQAPPSVNLQAPLGVGRVQHSGKIALQALLSAYRSHLQKQHCLCEQAFDYKKLILHDTGCQYDDITARYVVFCEGYGLTANPFFADLPLKGNKGEVLTVRIPSLRLSAVVKSAVFLLPLPEQGKDIFLLGATYHWTDKTSTPTLAARQELLDKLGRLLPPNWLNKVQVLEHRAGMRPTVIDRRPLLGRHQQHPNVFVFNGLGTRGVMLGATMAPLLYDFIVHRQALPPEVDIARF